ncbi:MAG: hypothetical protein HY775_04945 [Acidobacteria bacterium]|nr:hypothetical protein [Acidobacteriota bacterium]
MVGVCLTTAILVSAAAAGARLLAHGGPATPSSTAMPMLPPMAPGADHSGHVMPSGGRSGAAQDHGTASHDHTGVGHGSDGAVNWYAVGAFVGVAAAGAAGASATKMRLRRRMLSGELAGAGVRDV